MNLVKAFVAGFVSTLVFHQGVLGIFHLAGVAPAPYQMGSTWPLHVPQVISLAFWGGIWAIALWYLLRRTTGARYWLGWLVAGAIGPSVVALFVVFPLKGLPLAGGWNPKLMLAALILNGAWGIGAAIFLKLFPPAYARSDGG